jgi:hypothetical protein
MAAKMEIANFRRSQLFIELPSIRLNCSKLVQCRKYDFLIIFILPLLRCCRPGVAASMAPHPSLVKPL